MRPILAFFALLALILTPLAPAMAGPDASDHCAAMSDQHHKSAPEGEAAQHQCCTSAMPSLPDRVAEVVRPEPLAPATPTTTVLALTLSSRPHTELRPPRTA